MWPTPKSFPPYSIFTSTLRRKLPNSIEEKITEAYEFSKSVGYVTFNEFASSLGLLDYVEINGDEWHVRGNINEWYRVDPTIYIKSKLMFEQKKLSHMVDYLELYNVIDTVCLTSAFTSYCGAFFREFQVNPLEFLSLPAMAEQIMWHEYSTEVNAPFTFGNDDGHIHQKIKSHILGGLSTCFARHVEIQPKDEERKFDDSVYETPNGDPITQVVAWDVNSKLSDGKHKLINV